MNVDLVRALDSKTPDASPSARSGGGGPGFPELMDSLLRRGPDDRPSGRKDPSGAAARPGPAREERAERGSRSEHDGRSAHSDPEAMRAGARRAQEEAAAEPRAQDPQPANAPAPASTRRAGSDRKQGSELGEEDATGAAEPQVVPAEAAVVAAVGTEWLALATGGLGEGASPVDEQAVDAAIASTAVGADGLVDAIGGVVASDGAMPTGSEAAAAPGLTTRPAVVDARVVQTPAAALEGARGSETATAEAESPATVDVEPVVAETPAAERPVELPTSRPAGVRAESTRRDGEAPMTRGTETVVRPELAAAPAGGADERPMQERPREPQASPAPAVEPTRAESPSAAPATVGSAATASDPVELAGQSQDTSAAGRGEGMPPTQPMRAPEPLSPMQTGRPMPASAPDSIAVQTDWLATRGGGTARLVLHPPELGEIAIRVTVRNQAVDVVMVAHTALAHQVAEDQADRLSQAFAGRDLRLEQFEVRRGDPSDASSTGQFGSSDAGARERERAEDERNVDRGGVARGDLRRGAAGAESGAAPPRIASSGRAAGIDLRI